MKSALFIPNSLNAAGTQLRNALKCTLDQLSKERFMNVWCSVSYLFPGLHPDGFEDLDSGWPRALRKIAAEAWRRAEAGDISDEELYPVDAAWAGVYDRMLVHYPNETERRLELASQYGQPVIAEI